MIISGATYDSVPASDLCLLTSETGLATESRLTRLRRHHARSTQSLRSLSLRYYLNSSAVIRKSRQVAVRTKKQIFRLDIAMYDMFRMQVG